MVLSSEGLHLLSSVAVWRHDFETINDKNVALWHRYYTDVINYYIMKENDCQLIISNNKKKEYSTPDGWEVFRFQVSEEHRINQTSPTSWSFKNERGLLAKNRRRSLPKFDPSSSRRRQNISNNCVVDRLLLIY